VFFSGILTCDLQNYQNGGRWELCFIAGKRLIPYISQMIINIKSDLKNKNKIVSYLPTNILESYKLYDITLNIDVHTINTKTP